MELPDEPPLDPEPPVRAFEEPCRSDEPPDGREVLPVASGAERCVPVAALVAWPFDAFELDLAFLFEAVVEVVDDLVSFDARTLVRSLVRALMPVRVLVPPRTETPTSPPPTRVVRRVLTDTLGS